MKHMPKPQDEHARKLHSVLKQIDQIIKDNDLMGVCVLSDHKETVYTLQMDSTWNALTWNDENNELRFKVKGSWEEIGQPVRQTSAALAGFNVVMNEVNDMLFHVGAAILQHFPFITTEVRQNRN